MSQFLPSRTVRMIVLLVLLAGLAGRGALAEVFNPETFTLDNGMEVVVIENHRAPVVTHMVWYRVGAMDEPPDRSGLAHYLEHLMFKGTDTLEPGEFSAIVKRNGGQENAFTGQDYTGYWQSVAVDRLETVMRIEADRMVNLTLTAEEIEPERGVILEERNSRIESSPGAILGESVNTAFYQNHPYRIPIIGWEDEIVGLSLEDIRSFYRDWYSPNNAILVIAGDITADQVRPLAEKYYGVIPARPLPERVVWHEPAPRADQRVVYRDQRVRQPSWSRRYSAPSFFVGATEHAYPLEVLAEVLGGGSTTRLYRSLVVEQGIAVNAGAYFGAGRRGPGTFGFYASPKPGVEMAEIEAAVEREIQKLVADGITQQELDEAVVRMQDAAIFARDSLQGPAQVLGAALAIGRTVEDVESWPERIGAVTLDDVNAAIEAVFDGKPTVTSELLPKGTT